MCGRYSRTTKKEELLRRFRIERVETDLFGPRYNVAPSQACLVVVEEGGKRVIRAMRWGLVPSWAKDGAPGPINARAETVAVKPMFRSLLKGKRCIVPADGFYEWRKIPGQKAKVPYRIMMEDGEPFAFAGLWDAWISPHGEEVQTFTLLTTEPNETVKPIHDRMPVILAGEDAERDWLSGTPQDAMATLKPVPDGLLRTHPVSTLVNAPGNDLPECLTRSTS